MPIVQFNELVYSEFNYYYFEDENIPFEGYACSYYENGQLRTRKEFHKGVNCGIFEIYYENGMLARRCHSQAGLLHGIQTEYNEEGSVIERSFYEFGIEIWIKRYDILGKEIDIK
jgi:antitoxin component YwqK of YwqJK toxin-antitoxin module